LPTPFSSTRRTPTNGGCASTIPTSTDTTPRTPSGCHRLIKSSTPRQTATYSAFSTATRGITRLLTRKMTRRDFRISAGVPMEAQPQSMRL
jgi:hypothetical protein